MDHNTENALTSDAKNYFCINIDDYLYHKINYLQTSIICFLYWYYKSKLFMKMSLFVLKTYQKINSN